jgi:hypothetical protein
LIYFRGRSLSALTLTDRGTWLSSPSLITDKLQIFKAGSNDAADPLLSPAHVLLGAKADAGGQKIIGESKKFGQILYSKAPEKW